MESLNLTDPRPDLCKYEDANFESLLKEAEDFDAELALLLHGFRCQGTVIKNGRLQPVIHEKLGWPSREEYEKERVRLMPYRDMLTQAIKNITAKPVIEKKEGKKDVKTGSTNQNAVLSDTKQDTVYAENLFSFSC